MTLFKLCGLRSHDEVELAAELGAAFVGFVTLAPGSIRDLDPEDVARLVKEAPPEVESVLVTPCTDVEAIGEVLALTRPDVAQLTGELSADETRRVRDEHGVQLWRAFTPGLDPDADERTIHELADSCDALVIDSMVDGYGGTGEPIDWDHGRRIVDALEGYPVVLAGGLNADNVGMAIRYARPWCVDVSTGIETEGRKDPDRMQAFAQAVKEAETTL